MPLSEETIRQFGHAKTFPLGEIDKKKPLHMSARTDWQMCVERNSARGAEDLQDYDHQDWFYGYRGWYYNSGYAPYRLGKGDYSSFESYDDFYEDWDDDHAGDFYDS